MGVVGGLDRGVTEGAVQSWKRRFTLSPYTFGLVVKEE